MSTQRFDAERFEELRAARALGALTAAECAELTALLALRAGIDLESDELAVAAVELASLDAELAPLPAALAQKLEADARAFSAKAGVGSAPSGASDKSALAQAGPGSAPSPVPSPAVNPSPGSAPSSTPSPSSKVMPQLAPQERASTEERRPRPPQLAWGWLAAAAALVIALVGWWPRLQSTSPLSPTAARDALLAKAGVLNVAWKGTDFAPGADGDVVWDPREQRGFMRIRGLARNDPTREQYQLWIFDETQQHPVDGGVFDVGADGELIVPIDAKLFVAKPTLFAVTVERPGGVVVSAQEKIVLAGKI